MTTMIERVAKQLHETLSSQDIDGYLGANFDLHAAARAAIEAMREPTKAQLEAAEDIVVGYDDFACGDGNIYLGTPGYPKKTRDVWAALVDASLEETP